MAHKKEQTSSVPKAVGERSHGSRMVEILTSALYSVEFSQQIAQTIQASENYETLLASSRMPRGVALVDMSLHGVDGVEEIRLSMRGLNYGAGKASAKENTRFSKEHIKAAIRRTERRKQTERGLVFDSDELVDERPFIWGVFLYTEDDKEVSHYIRNNYLALSKMSGKTLRIFVIEEPQEEEKVEAKWAVPLTRLANKRTKPYDKRQAYDVGQILGVYPDQFPCVVIFEKFND
jgi:hypothetical protein